MTRIKVEDMDLALVTFSPLPLVVRIPTPMIPLIPTDLYLLHLVGLQSDRRPLMISLTHLMAFHRLLVVHLTTTPRRDTQAIINQEGPRRDVMFRAKSVTWYLGVVMEFQAG